jgi:putative hemolysin
MPDFGLSYVIETDPWWKRTLMRGIEDASGRRRILPLYQRWGRDKAGRSPTQMQDLLDATNVRLAIHEPEGWTPPPADLPLVVVANHPFGIADGVALLAIVERLGRPYKILIHKDLLRIPEIRPVALPVDFAATREAVETNLATRAEARRLVKGGTILVIFPAGGVATAESITGTAEELPWKPFVAALITQSKASVLPVFFEGQNSRLFHLVSRYSLSLRLSLLVSEVRRVLGGTIHAHVGPVVPFAELSGIKDRRALVDDLHVRVHRLAPGAANRPRSELLPRPAEARRRWPWDVETGPVDRSDRSEGSEQVKAA